MGEKFAANPVTGTGSLSVPIYTSPGRSGFGPQLSLSYDSGAGNGVFGFGWSLSLPSITRKTDKGLPRYQDADESDVFILSGAEDLVPVLDGENGWTRLTFDGPPHAPGYRIDRYRPRIEGLFARIERWTRKSDGDVHWRSISRDNTTTLYGKTNENRVADPADPRLVFSWLICESYDDKGNAIVYEYQGENSDGVDLSQVHEKNRSRTANRYLKRIKYGNRVSRLIQPDLTQAEWMFEAVLDYDEGHYEDLDLDPTIPEAEQHRYVRASASSGEPWSVRPDPFSSHRAGFEMRAYRRCRRVLMFHRFEELGEEPYLVRSTELDYEDLDYSQPTTIAGELAHAGSTRFASFVRSVTQSGFVRDDTQAVVEEDGVRYVTYLKKSLPPLEFGYSKATIQDDIRDLDPESLENLPVGLDGAMYQWIDLDGEGLSGILTEQAEGWFYKRNLSPVNLVRGDGNEHAEARFGPAELVAENPSLAAVSDGGQQFLDLAGDGRLDLVALDGPTPGFYERSDAESWSPHLPFDSMPDLDWSNPNLKFVDLTGDGHADVLITEEDVITWYPSLAEDGFAPAERVHGVSDEEKGPRLVFADGTQSIYLADMCGDGLTDIVRIRNGEVCYWPSLGYGRFGAKVAMDDAPWFDNPDRFDHRRIRLADIDGSGTNDIVYLGRDGARLYFNQAGNRWSEGRRLSQFPPVDNLSSMMTVDLLGNGTACLVWSSPSPRDSRRQMRYIDLMGGQKPHLLIRSVNNLGAETHVQYAPSTKFYLADKLAGKPWITRLPFPVHVVERVETHDRISGNRFVARYAYHHGYFDGVEREFRGFGLVEQFDTEMFSALGSGGEFTDATNVEESSHVPPVHTKTWFHTGVHLGRDHVSNFFAGLLDERDVGEYYREPSLSDERARELLLEDTVLPEGLSVEEEGEACRALKGSMIRQEIYARDGTDMQIHPYTVAEQNFAMRLVQPRAGNRHAVFFTHPHEAIERHYERDPDDPRTSHALTLETDAFGNVLKEAFVRYGRRLPDMSLSAADRAEQARTHITYTENRVTNAIDDLDDYRPPLPCETRAYELTGLVLPAGRNRFTLSEVLGAGAGAVSIPYEQSPTPGVLQKRLIEQARTLYRRNDLTGALPLGELQSLALPFESYRLAFTPGLSTGVYGGRVTDGMLETEGGYVHGEGDANWWMPSGRVFYSAVLADTPPQELAYARQHFFQPRRYRDPFHTDPVNTETSVTYDAYDLLLVETRDALGNRLTVGARTPSGDIDPNQPGNDYRVIQPRHLMDPNRNRSAAAFDALGMVAGTAVMGKPEDNPVPGDSLASTFRTDLTRAEIDQFFADPKGPVAASLLDSATTRIVYDPTRYWRRPDPTQKPPAFAATLARETHASDPVPTGGLKIQVGFSYSDGFAREIQKKLQAEPGPGLRRDTNGNIILGADGRPEMTPNDVSPRWMGNGWTVFNNKGKPARQYEPFFTDTHDFEFDIRVGVSPVLFYDPVERVVATVHPNHTWEKVVFGPWRQETWDVNDTVLVTDPKTDPEVGDLFRRLPDADYLPTWHARRRSGALGPEELEAARKTEFHADTPTVDHFDSLGRAFLIVAHNRLKYSNTPPANPPIEEFRRRRVVFDIEGNQRELTDERVDDQGASEERIVMRYEYDICGNRIRTSSMEAGERWMLNDVVGNPLYAWDSRDHRVRTAYDQLRRPTESFLREGTGAELVEGRAIYGESRPDPEANNLRGRTVQLFDHAGVITSDDYDFRGNPLRVKRRLAQEYKTIPNWASVVPLEAQTYVSLTRYDALDRPIELTTPDDSVIRPAYNEANLLERVEANLRGSAVVTPFVTNIDYDARGQRTSVGYGNDVRTTYTYDPLTFRLVRLLTRRDATTFPDDCPHPQPVNWPGCQVQNLHYTYDPVGNITHIRDDAQQTVYFRNKRVEPSADYTYDAIYQLIEAAGREHLGQVGGQPRPPTIPDASNAFHTRLDHPGDGIAMGTYIERYVHDTAGNILSMQHRGGDPTHPGWVRDYFYNEPSLLEPSRTSNRLSNTTVGSQGGQPVTEPCTYDGHGNITKVSHLSLMRWNANDRLQATSRQVLDNGGTPETTWYVYDSGGQRVRKVTERQSAAGQAPRRRKERIYLGGFEIYREYGSNGHTVQLERETLHVMDDGQRLALVETRTKGTDPAPERLIRYQHGNHLGSVTLELDDLARIISYEEYYPYGSTSFQAVRSQIEAPKRYRYTGNERDEETGFGYHGARYCAPWLGRWVSCDPIGTAGGLNLYAYALNNPLRLLDPHGTQPEPANYLTQDDKGNYIVPGETIEVTGKAPEPDLLEVGVRGKFVHLLTQGEFERQQRFALEHGTSDYSWTWEEHQQYAELTSAEQAGMAQDKWWEHVNKKYDAYRSGKYAEWDKSTRLMYGYGKIGKGIGWVTVAAVAAFAGGAGYVAAESSPFVFSTATSMMNSGPLVLLGSILYGTCTPPGAPDLPGPGDEVGKILQKLGASADDIASFARGEKVWIWKTQGEVKTTSYFQYAGGKLVAGVLELKNLSPGEKPSMDTVRAIKSFMDQSTELAQTLSANTLRLEGNAVTNLGEKGVEGLLGRLGFKLDPEDPGKLIRETVVTSK